MINNRLNAICPYFAMFPLDFPMRMLAQYGGTRILDPFCGRGTTNMAARMNGSFSVGIDSSRVAYAISSAKMVDVAPEEIVRTCRDILNENREANTPRGEFWEMMYDPEVLQKICDLRQALLEDCTGPERTALRGIVLGALHGPLRADGSTSYLSNQFPRTYASKPAYSVKFWKSKGFYVPPKADVLGTVSSRAERCYSEKFASGTGFIVNGDSTERSTFEHVRSAIGTDRKFDTVITSPPYHGMNTYVPDQWIRNWFVGGPDRVQYSARGQTSGKLETFVKQLNAVWKNCEEICGPGSNICVRFGDIGSKETDPEETIMKTFDGTSWTDIEVAGAGAPSRNRRASNSFSIPNLRDYREIDVHAALTRGDGKSIRPVMPFIRTMTPT